MEILNDLLTTLAPGNSVRDVRQGTFQTAVLTRDCGLASTLRGRGSHHGDVEVREAGSLIGRDALEVARLALSSSLLEAAIGMATINSLIEVDEERCIDLNAGDLLIQRGQGKLVTLIGHFPFVPELRQSANELWVIEQRPEEGDLGEAEADKFVPQADVVGITGSAFTNHTIDHLLGLCRRDAYVVVLGPTTPLSSVLFDYGVSAISGTKVTDSELVLRAVSQGAGFRQIKGISLLTMKRSEKE